MANIYKVEVKRYGEIESYNVLSETAEDAAKDAMRYCRKNYTGTTEVVSVHKVLSVNIAYKS